MGIELNSQQEECVKQAIKWYRNPCSKQTFQISGPAGSGKTTIVKTIIERLGLDSVNVLFVAFVGKAALQLTRSGVEGKTIHSVFYNIEFDPVFDENGNGVMRNGRLVTRPRFVKKERIPNYIKLIVVDEGTMVNEDIARDMESFGIPMIILGDLQQLPPVIGNTPYLIRPDYVLTKIMRQQENNPIIYLSQLASKGKNIPYGRYGKKCFVIPKEMINKNMLKGADMVLIPKNSSRIKLNKYIREEIYGYDTPFPVVGEKLICRKNNWGRMIGNGISLVNGMDGYIERIHKESFNGKTLSIDFRPSFEENTCFKNVTLDYKVLTSSVQEDNTNIKKGFSYDDIFEYGYVKTVHLSQGSQADNVLFISEPFGGREMGCKINYTGITRAKEGLVFAY